MQAADNSSDSRLRLASLWYLVGAAMLLGVAYLSLAPILATGVSDKLSHLITYAVLSGWFSLLVAKRLSLLWVIAGLIAYGAIIEFLQGMTGYRYVEFGDFVANSIGVVLGSLVYFSPLPSLLLAMDQQLSGVFQR